MNITKVAAALGHFTAADPDDETLFDRIVKPHDIENELFDDAKQAVIRRYQLNEDEFLLFREWCLKIVDVDAIVPRQPKGMDISLPRVATSFLALFGMDNLDAFSDMIDTSGIIDEAARQIRSNLNENEISLLVALCDVVTDHVDGL
jgi:hypothetical protein